MTNLCVDLELKLIYTLSSLRTTASERVVLQLGVASWVSMRDLCTLALIRTNEVSREPEPLRKPVSQQSLQRTA